MLQFLTAIIVTGVPNLVRPTLFCACYQKMCTFVSDQCFCLSLTWKQFKF